MNKLTYFLGATALMLTTLPSCNNDDEPTSNPNSILEEEDYEEGDSVQNKIIVVSFDKFEDQNTSEISIADTDTTTLLLNKSYLTRHNEAIKDTNTYIVVWDKPTNMPYVTKVTDAEEAGDQLKISVKHAVFSDVIPEGSYDLAIAPYLNSNETVRNTDGSINSDCFVDEDGAIHPVAIFVEGDQSLKKSSTVENDSATQESNINKWDVGLVEGLTDDNAAFDGKINLAVNVDKGVKKTWTLTEGSWGKATVGVGFNELALKAVEGFHVQLNTTEEWKKTSWWPHLWYPSVTVANFAIAQYGDISATADLSVAFNLLVEKGHVAPAGDYIAPTTTEEDEEDGEVVGDDDEDNDYAEDEGGAYDKVVSNGLHAVADNDSYYTVGKDNFAKQTTSKGQKGEDLITFKAYPVVDAVLFIGPVPVVVAVTIAPKVRFYPPKITATASLGLNAKYSMHYHAGFGYARDNNQKIELGDGTKINMNQGWDSYTNYTTTEKSLKLYAGLKGAMTTRIGVFFSTGVSLYGCANVSMDLGLFLRGTVSGNVSGFEYDITSGTNSFVMPNANLGACVDLGVGGEVGGKLSAFGVKDLASTSMELLFFQWPIWKGLLSTKVGQAYSGPLTNKSDASDTQDIKVKIRDKNHWNCEFLPDNLSLYNSFLRADTLMITLPEMTVAGVKIPETVFHNVKRTLSSDNEDYTDINESATPTVDGHTVSYSIKNGKVVNSGTPADNKYYDLSFDLDVAVDGKTYSYSFKNERTSSKSFRVPYAID